MTEPIRRNMRDSAIWVVALALIVYEALTQSSPRETLIILYGTMLGLPFALRADDARQALRRRQGKDQ